jgi:hypothetical protein
MRAGFEVPRVGWLVADGGGCVGLGSIRFPPGVRAPFGTTPSTGGGKKSDRASINVNFWVPNRRCRAATNLIDGTSDPVRI